MLTLKMMSSQDLADCCASKCFVLVDLQPGSAIQFGRDHADKPEVTITSRDGEIEKWSPGGNTYVMQDGKTISTFAYSA